MSTPDPAGPLDPSLDRFSRAERWIHGLTAVLMIVCIATAAVLYNESLAVMVGHRYVVENVHVYTGFALPVPIVLGMLSRTFRADARRLNRFTRDDRAWLRSRSRRDGAIAVGKFNAGQKLNASISTGSIGVLLGSGLVMYLTSLTPLAWRSGATFVHDWFALGLGLLVLGHLAYAFRDRDAMGGMWTGRVPTSWARREHAAWAREVADAEAE